MNKYTIPQMTNDQLYSMFSLSSREVKNFFSKNGMKLRQVKGGIYRFGPMEIVRDLEDTEMVDFYIRPIGNTNKGLLCSGVKGAMIMSMIVINGGVLDDTEHCKLQKG